MLGNRLSADFLEKSYYNEAHEQYSLLDTTFKYIFHFGIPGIRIFHVQSDNHTSINNSANRKHVFDLTTQTNNSTLQSGLVVIKMQLNAFSVIYGTMINNVIAQGQKSLHKVTLSESMCELLTLKGITGARSTRAHHRIASLGRCLASYRIASWKSVASTTSMWQVATAEFKFQFPVPAT